MKVLFLDIDGVVNCEKTMQRHRGAIGIDPYMAFLVGRIVETTGAKVVLSSSWRHWPDGVAEVERQVVKLHDITPDGKGLLCRGHEIAEWLETHPGVEKYAILDDNADFHSDQMPNFFKTSWLHGLDDEVANKVIEHLT